MKILVACEESQVVTKAFRDLGHEAYSCDIDPCSGGHPEWHIQDDVLKHVTKGWDMMIAHPPCTYLTVCGNKWMGEKYRDRFPNRPQQRLEAISFFMALWQAPIERIAVENPVGVMSRALHPAHQYVQPYWFGDTERKKTGLWLKNLPKLKPTNMVEPELITFKDGKTYSKWHAEPKRFPAKERTRLRSKTFQGLAQAIAEQWGALT